MSPSIRALSDRPLPSDLYLDAGFFVHVLYRGSAYRKEALELLKDAVAFGPPRLYASSIVVPEVNDAIFKKLLRARGEGELLQDKRLLNQADPQIWASLKDLSDKMEDLIRLGRIELCRADGPIRSSAWALQEKFRLRAFDAVHLATCHRRGFKDIITFDRDFLDPLDESTVVWTARELRRQWLSGTRTTSQGTQS